ncbi:MAG: RNA-binding cell elongation regulator Jag/EloR [Bacilli bacterium]
MKKNIYTAKTKEEAIDLAISQLQLLEKDLIIKENETKSTLFGGKKVEIEVISIDEVINFIKYSILDITKKMGIDSKIEVKKRDEIVKFSLFANNNAILIGKNGKTIESLSIIIKQMVRNEIGCNYNFVIDVAEYKENREKDLEGFAKRIAKEVKNTNIEVKLHAMNSYERRIIHNALNDDEFVNTSSEGEEPNRYVVVKPKGE